MLTKISPSEFPIRIPGFPWEALAKGFFLAFLFGISDFVTAWGATDSNSSTSATMEIPSLALGVQAGMSFANTSNPANITSSARTGFTGGINVEANLAPGFAIQPELNYVQRGANFVDAEGLSVNVKFDALEVPVLLKAKLDGTIHPEFFAGPVAVFNISRSVEASAAGKTTTLSFQPAAMDIALAFGGGLQFGPLFGNLRYSLGLLDIDQNHANYKSRGFQLMVGLRFGYGS